MPYRLRKAPRRDAYWVVDDTGKHYSKDPLPKERAREQQKALYAAEGRKGLRGGTELEKQLHKKRMLRRAKRDIERDIAEQQQTLTDIPPGLTLEELDAPYLRIAQERLFERMRDMELLRPEYAEAKKGVKYRFHGYGVRGGATPEEARALWDAVPPPKKGVRETEEDYQKRLLRVKQQNERFATAGITPQGRSASIAAANKARQLKAARDVLGQEAVAAAYERDPNVIAKRAEIERKRKENEVFNPILRGLIDVAKVGSELPFIPQPVREVGSMTADYLGSTMDAEEQRRAEIEQQRAEKMAALQPYNEQMARQLAEARQQVGDVSFRDLDRQIAEQERLARGGARMMPRFQTLRYF